MSLIRSHAGPLGLAVSPGWRVAVAAKSPLCTQGMLTLSTPRLPARARARA
ncbi:hypothetical protein UCD39_06910 [Nitrospirillum sp. BR 11752]|uniref:hypothetical protein n=1 Tax=Nitrospirillum sp. BR 11752 TaxID=3104293 RepID=UPI002E9FB3A8|nr:hypothetical protein [Nitrospirillum sp. BR 11752]